MHFTQITSEHVKGWTTHNGTRHTTGDCLSNSNSLLVDFGPSFATVLGADEGRDGKVLVCETDARTEDAAAVERVGVTVATLARRLSGVHSTGKVRYTCNYYITVSFVYKCNELYQ